MCFINKFSPYDLYKIYTKLPLTTKFKSVIIEHKDVWLWLRNSNLPKLHVFFSVNFYIYKKGEILWNRSKKQISWERPR